MTPEDFVNKFGLDKPHVIEMGKDDIPDDILQLMVATDNGMVSGLKVAVRNMLQYGIENKPEMGEDMFIQIVLSHVTINIPRSIAVAGGQFMKFVATAYDSIPENVRETIIRRATEEFEAGMRQGFEGEKGEDSND